MQWIFLWPLTIVVNILRFRILIMLFSNKLISKPNDRFAWQNNQQFFHEIQIPKNSYPTVMSRGKYIETNFSIKSTLSPLLNRNEPCLFTMSTTHCTAFYVYCFYMLLYCHATPKPWYLCNNIIIIQNIVTNLINLQGIVSGIWRFIVVP